MTGRTAAGSRNSSGDSRFVNVKLPTLTDANTQYAIADHAASTPRAERGTTVRLIQATSSATWATRRGTAPQPDAGPHEPARRRLRSPSISDIGYMIDGQGVLGRRDGCGQL